MEEETWRELTRGEIFIASRKRKDGSFVSNEAKIIVDLGLGFGLQELKGTFGKRLEVIRSFGQLWRKDNFGLIEAGCDREPGGVAIATHGNLSHVKNLSHTNLTFPISFLVF